MPIPPVAIRFGGMGDMVMLLPALFAIRNSWGRFPKIITSGHWSEPILRAGGVDSEVVVAPGTRRRPYLLSRSKQHARRWLKELSPPILYSFETANRYHDVVAHAGLADVQVVDARKSIRQLKEHEIDFLLRIATASTPFARDASAEVIQVAPKLQVMANQQQETRHWLASHEISSAPVLVQPGNKRTMSARSFRRASNRKYWPLWHWARVVEGVRSRRPDTDVLLMGTREERELNEEILAHPSVKSDRRVHNVAGDVPVSRLISLAAMAHSLISVDTGPAHVGAAVSCPLIVLFGATDPARYRPRSLGVVGIVTERGISLAERVPKCWDSSCTMEGIDAESVLRAWQLVLDRSQSLKVDG